MKINLRIYGIECVACSNQLKRIFNKIPNINNLNININSSSVSFEFYEYPDFKKIEKLLKRNGYSLIKDKVVIKTNINEFNNKKDNILDKIPYFSNYEIKDNEIILFFYSSINNLNELINLFKENDLDIKIVKKENGNEDNLASNQVNLLIRLLISVFLSVPLLWNPSPLFQLVLATLILLIPGSYFIKRGLKIFNGNLNMDFLISISMILIYVYSTYLAFTSKDDIKLYFLCEGVLVSLVLFGRYLEIVARSETEKSLNSFINLIPRKCNLYKDNNIKEVDVDEINVNDILSIKSGERIPLDGIIIKGDGLIDESIITGESELINKSINQEVIGGTLLRKGEILIKITHNSSDIIIEKMIDVIRNSQVSDSNYKKLADKIVTFFIPIVILISIITFLIWYFIIDKFTLNNALLSSIGVLVVSCPCALGLAIPTSLMVGSEKALEFGILFKNGNVIEKINKTKIIAFDKTGTLTIGGNDTNRNYPRSGVQEVIKELSKKYKIVMISGDKKDIALKVGKEVGIEEIYYEVDPFNKLEIIKNLKKEGNLMYIGDGVNDSLSMNHSDVSISIQNASQIAKDTADIIILNDDIKKIPLIFKISSKIMKNIYINLLWALIYNFIAIPLAACGFINPSLASAAMSFSSIAVLLNSLLLRKIRE